MTELNSYYISAFKASDGRTLYAARICSPLLDCEDIFDSQENAEAFIARETARLAPYGITLRRVDAPTEMTSIQRAYAQDDAEFFRKEEHGPLYISKRRWTSCVVNIGPDLTRARETCCRLADLNGDLGFKWEPASYGDAINIYCFCNWWEEQQVNNALG